MIYSYKLDINFDLTCEELAILRSSDTSMLVFEKEYNTNIILKHGLNKIRHDYTYFSLAPLSKYEQDALHKDMLQLKLVSIQYIIDDVKKEYRQSLKTINERKKNVISKLNNMI